MTKYLDRFAAQFGVQGMERSERMPSTRRTLAVAEFARDQGKLNEFRRNVMKAHWEDSKDIEDRAVLAELAADSGLDPERALVAADDETYLKRLDEMRQEYKQVGVGGIPTFVFGTERVEGCQSYEILSAAALKAGAKYR
jgi:predicted DsbA family dithiol-disulfide isomerase